MKLTVVNAKSKNGESKRSLNSGSGEHKRSVRNFDCEKNEIAKHCWKADQNFSVRRKLLVGKAG